MRAAAGLQVDRFELGDWMVDRQAKRLECGNQQRQLEPRVIDVLVALCAQPGEVLSAEDLLARCWPEGEPAGDNPVHKAITLLRKALGDSATEPRYIETIRKRGYRVIAPVRGQDGQARSGAWQGGSPFRGLQAFDCEHAAVFFGREQATAELLACARQQMQRQHGLVLVLGPSGSGKTSLVSAGLVPALRRELLDGRWRLLSHSQLDLADLPGAGQAETTAQPPGFALALAAALLDWETPSGEPLLAGFNAHDLARSLSESPATVLTELRAALQRHSGVPDERPFALLFLDRLEALFRPPWADEAQREQAFALLQQLAESGLVLLIAACRNDYYPQLAQHAWLMRDKAQGGHLDLAPPSAAEIAQMVRLPARAAGLSFGVDPATHQRLDDLLCDAAASSPDALPLLQYTLEQLYEQRSPHGELSFVAYHALGGGAGGLEGVIAEQAEQLIRGLTLVQQGALPQVLALLVLVGEDEASPVGGRRALWSELRQAAERELVQALVDARLLVSERGSDLAQDEPGFRVAHEALLRRWPRVTEWIAEHRQHLQARARLRQQVQRWTQGARAAEFLWPRGRQLQDALTLRQQGLLALSAPELDFLNSCERRAAWAGRLKGGAIAALAGLTLLAGGMAWRAQQAEQLAQQKRASSERLLGYMLGELSEQLRPEGKLSLLEGLGQQALAVLGDDAATQQLSPAERLQRVKALLMLGEVHFEKQQFKPAGEAFEAASRLIRPAPGTPQLASSDTFRAWGATEFWLGRVARDRGLLDEAEQHYKTYRLVCQQWGAALPTDEEAQLELSMAETNLGVLALRRLDLGQAVQKIDAAVVLGRALQSRHPDSLQHLELLLSSLSWAMEAAVMASEPQRALKLSDEALRLGGRWRSLVPDDQRLQKVLATVYDWRELAFRDLGLRQEADDAQRQYIRLRQQLAGHDPANTDWQWLLVRAQLNQLLQRPPAQIQATEVASVQDRSQALKGSISASQLRTVEQQLGLLWARQQMHKGRATDALMILKQAPSRPNTGLLNLRWADLLVQAELDAMQLELLALTADPNRHSACAEARSFWAPVRGTALQARFGALNAQLASCPAASQGLGS